MSELVCEWHISNHREAELLKIKGFLMNLIIVPVGLLMICIIWALWPLFLCGYIPIGYENLMGCMNLIIVHWYIPVGLLMICINLSSLTPISVGTYPYGVAKFKWLQELVIFHWYILVDLLMICINLSSPHVVSS